MEKQKIVRQSPGPLAEKIIRSATKYTKSKVVDFNAWKAVKSHHKDLQQFHLQKDLSQFDPLHAIYLDTQHHLIDFVGQLSSLPESHKLNKNYEEAEDTYMPSGPPMSPITHSYFVCWSSFDMCVGLKRETYASIVIDCCRAFGIHSDFVTVLEQMQQSYMGLYVHEGYDKKFVYLRELYTGKTVKTLVTSGYWGTAGEIWLVRLFPDPIGGHFDYSISFTTPYVIIDFPLGKKIERDVRKLMSSEKEWMEFIERNLPRIQQKDSQQAYYHFMKYGLTKFYWPEYIFQAYVNHRSDFIWLTGFPDRPESLPHSDKNDAQRMGE